MIYTMTVCFPFHHEETKNLILFQNNACEVLIAVGVGQNELNIQ